MDSCLSVCASCHRHVRPSAEPCPFCGAALPDPVDRPRPARHMSRPARLAFGAAVSATLAMGCAESTRIDSGVAPDDAGVVVADAGGSDAATPDAATSDDAGFDAGFDAGDIALPYGAPPMRDAWV